jgi:mannose/cellobiose epimerase-like protein (N-acyl-D-glucosamine 2-epimerase family)
MAAPHNQQSLYYQYAFFGEHGRWPTWKDAVAHCAPEVAAARERELRKRSAWSEPP